ncbi:hypothetical protein HDV02_006120, partial [Globomyces sp. JEL0801]
KRIILKMIMSLLTPTVRQSIPFMCFFVGSVAMGVNLGQLQKLKHDIRTMEMKNSQTRNMCHQLELEKLKLETAFKKPSAWL